MAASGAKSGGKPGAGQSLAERIGTAPLLTGPDTAYACVAEWLAQLAAGEAGAAQGAVYRQRKT